MEGGARPCRAVEPLSPEFLRRFLSCRMRVVFLPTWRGAARLNDMMSVKLLVHRRCPVDKVGVVREEGRGQATEGRIARYGILL